MVHVNLLRSVYVLTHQSKVVEVALRDTTDVDGCYFLEPSSLDSGLRVDPSLLQVVLDEPVLPVVSNPLEVSATLEAGDLLGMATLVDIVSPAQGADELEAKGDHRQ